MKGTSYKCVRDIDLSFSKHQLKETPIPCLRAPTLGRTNSLVSKHQLRCFKAPNLGSANSMFQTSICRGCQSILAPPFHPHFVNIFSILPWTMFLFLSSNVDHKNTFLLTIFVYLYSLSRGI
jgi:hypothetical protein